MATSSKPRTVYYGWVIVPICMFALMLTVGSTSNAFGLYILPVSEAYGLSRATMNTGAILMNAGAAVVALLGGRLLDRYSARLIMGVSGVLLAVSLIALGLLKSVWLSAIVISVPLAVAFTGVGSLTGPALAARWFTVHRGRAMALIMIGMSSGTIFIVPIVAWLIDAVGWRRSLVVLGCVVGVLIAMLVPFIRNEPGPDDHETAAIDPAGTTATQENRAASKISWTTRQLLANSGFWAISLSTAFSIAIFQGILVALIPIGHEAGFSTTKSASLISALGLIALAMKLLIAWAGDKVERPLLLSIVFGVMAFPCATLLIAHSYALLLLCCLLLGASTGATMALYPALLADQFGAKSFGTANGNLSFMIAVLSASAVRFSGEVYDRTGGYDIMLYAFTGIALLNAVLMFMRWHAAANRVAAAAT